MSAVRERVFVRWCEAGGGATLDEWMAARREAHRLARSQDRRALAFQFALASARLNHFSGPPPFAGLGALGGGRIGGLFGRKP